MFLIFGLKWAEKNDMSRSKLDLTVLIENSNSRMSCFSESSKINIFVTEIQRKMAYPEIVGVISWIFIQNSQPAQIVDMNSIIC